MAYFNQKAELAHWLINILGLANLDGEVTVSGIGGTGRKPSEAAGGWALFFPRSTQTQRPPSSCWNVNPTFSCVCYGSTAPRRMRNAVTTCLQRASISTAIYLVSCHYVTRTVKHISLPGWSLGLFYERPRRRSLQPKRASTFYTEVLRALKCVFTVSDRDPTGLCSQGQHTAAICGACHTPLSLLIIWPACKQ